MEENQEKNSAPWLSVPQFGDWDQKGTVPDYSVDFSKIREMRKQNKRDVSRASIGHEEELFASNKSNADAVQNNIKDQYNDDVKDQSPAAKKNIFSCFNCCVKA